MSEPPSVESIFIEAIDLSGEAREALLKVRCGQDAELRAAVENLIRADEQAGQGDFLESKLLGETAPAPPADITSPQDPADPSDRFRILGAFREGGLGEVLLAHARPLARDESPDRPDDRDP